MSNILGVNIDAPVQAMIHSPLTGDGHKMMYAPGLRGTLARLAEESVDLVIAHFIPGVDGCELLEQLHHDGDDVKCLAVMEPGTPSVIIDALREHVCDFLTIPFTAAELRAAVSNTLAGCPAAEIEVASAHPEWVELRVPGDLAYVGPLQKLLTQLEADLPQEIREATTYALGEMLNNAIEHGADSNWLQTKAGHAARFFEGELVTHFQAEEMFLFPGVSVQSCLPWLPLDRDKKGSQ
jgi:DNA-binding response OmpR family regulator